MPEYGISALVALLPLCLRPAGAIGTVELSAPAQGVWNRDPTGTGVTIGKKSLAHLLA